jgi:hypothetical protein
MGILVRQEQIDTTEFEVSSFSNDVGTVEVGTTITEVNLSWSYTKNISSQSINQGIGSLETDVRDYADTGLSMTTTTTYTLVADGIPTGSDSANTTVSFKYKKFYGKDSDAGPLSDADIKALANSTFATSRATSFSITCSAEYIYISYPKSWGAASFKVNGLDNTAWTLYETSFTNDAGSTYDIYTYRSDNILTGTFDIEVL